MSKHCELNEKFGLVAKSGTAYISVRAESISPSCEPYSLARNITITALVGASEF
jgi:hypothetical protein